MNTLKKAWYTVLSGGGLLSSYKSKVLSDGGSITNEDYLKLRIDHARDNGYQSNIKAWYATEFGVKVDSGFLQKIYDVIDPENNSVVQNVGSEQPAFNATAQNSRSAAVSDGTDDSLQTTHGNKIADAGDALLLLVVKPIVHNANTNRFLVGEKSDKAAAVGIKESATSPVYTSSGTDISGVGNTFVINPSVTGMPLNNWYVVALNIKNNATWRLNDRIGQRYDQLDLTDDIDGITLFGNQRNSSPTAYLTRCEIAEYMIVQGGLSSSLINEIMNLINDHYAIFTEVDYSPYPVEGLSNIDGVFSLRKLISSYSGNCIRLRRSSDDAESDFGFVGDGIDIASITTWAGGSDLFVITWYDQSEVNDFVQATNANQMQFFTTGGGHNSDLPYIKGIAANNTFMTKTTTLTGTNLWRVYCHFSQSNIASAVLWCGGGSTDRFGAAARTTGGNIQIFKRIGSTSYSRSVPQYNSGTSPIAIGMFSNTANTPASTDLACEFQTQGEYGTPAVNPDYSKNGAGTITLGNGFNNRPFDGRIYEWIGIQNITHNQRPIQHNAIRHYQGID